MKIFQIRRYHNYKGINVMELSNYHKWNLKNKIPTSQIIGNYNIKFTVRSLFTIYSMRMA